MESQIPIFYLLTLEVPRGETGTKRYLYGGVPAGDSYPRLLRIRNIYDWESDIYRTSKLVLSERVLRSHVKSLHPRLAPDSHSIAIESPGAEIDLLNGQHQYGSLGSHVTARHLHGTTA
ncbi:peptidase S9, putative [Babesia ovis]|uniref:Peptidase S9, putative n=1 Tax=Babesia ovis TaxID=5869 RepID=A0A9W5TCF3_BABOV|nr:peptidase S9, putative [Babesia ovis]